MLLAILMACTFIRMPAQTPEQDLKDLLHPLLNAPYIHYEITCLYYDVADTKPSDTLLALFQRSGQQEYRRIGQMEILKIKDFTVMADHDDRAVSIRQSTKAALLDQMFDARQLNDLTETRQIQVQRNTVDILTITSADKPKDKMTIWYDPKNRIIREVTIVARDPFAAPYETQVGLVKIVIRFDHFSTTIKPFSHSVSEYVKRTGDRYVAVGKCKGYSVL